MGRYGRNVVVSRGHMPSLITQDRPVVEHMVAMSAPVMLPEPRHRISSICHRSQQFGILFTITTKARFGRSHSRIPPSIQEKRVENNSVQMVMAASNNKNTYCVYAQTNFSTRTSMLT
ncbi:hypothetical protein Zmor_026521 [Zophobas morio]|uniref:Uncharacterized protein n=1 Tax=Zophobas morio TaxID=2755281 RepID=A0AA38M4I7_9CUCU|nr:hypothetical protein Zmor_026521 [Zophobas morio]